MAKLTEKQKRFCEEYMIDMNATQAAIRAGYKEKTAGSQAHDILKKPEIQAYLSELIEKQQERTQITADMVLDELGKIAFSKLTDFYDGEGRLIHPENLPENASAAVATFKTRRESVGKNADGNDEFDTIDEYRRHDKVKALELIGRHFKMFTDKVEHSMDEELAQWLKK
ncbi:terminase small subunit [Sulfurimonas sp. HSL-1656]|uniref:terminase small subunit n=1 Tax=Thiomicrolovo subterrani TaxID=3131934 RepID=UPI0031F9F2EF